MATWKLFMDEGFGLRQIFSGMGTFTRVGLPAMPLNKIYRLQLQVCYESPTVTGCSFLSPGTNIRSYSPATCLPGQCTQSANSTLVALGGAGFQPVEGCAYQLTRKGTDPDGGRFLFDEWAVLTYSESEEGFSEVLADRSSSGHFAQAQGSCLAQGGITESPRQLAEILGKATNRSTRAAERSSIAMIAHVPHAMNERFMPNPSISLRAHAVPFTEPPIEALLRVAVGMDESIQEIDTVLSDSEIPAAVMRALRESLQIDYKDKRRHRMAVYALVRVAQGQVILREVLITLPECCPNCPPPPYHCQ